MPANAGDAKRQARCLGWKDPLEKEMATHSSILAWNVPWTEEPGGLQSLTSRRVRHDFGQNNNRKVQQREQCPWVCRPQRGRGCFNQFTHCSFKSPFPPLPLFYSPWSSRLITKYPDADPILFQPHSHRKILEVI